jgi:hypothetical protein
MNRSEIGQSVRRFTFFDVLLATFFAVEGIQIR